MSVATAGEFQHAVDHLRRHDPVLANLIDRIGPCTLKRRRSYFRTLLDSIVWQQLSWKAACAIHERMLKTLQTRHPRPGHILSVSERDLLQAGLSRQKALYLRELALFFESGHFPSRRIGRLDDGEIIDLLTQIRGVGRWTAEMFLIFGLNRPDVFPIGDLGLRKAICHHYRKPTSAKDRVLLTIANRWRPFRTVATWYLWKSGDGVFDAEPR